MLRAVEFCLVAKGREEGEGVLAGGGRSFNLSQPRLRFVVAAMQARSGWQSMGDPGGRSEAFAVAGLGDPVFERDGAGVRTAASPESMEVKTCRQMLQSGGLVGCFAPTIKWSTVIKAWIPQLVLSCCRGHGGDENCHPSQFILMRPSKSKISC